MKEVLSFQQNRGSYIVHGDFNKTFLSLCIKTGCNQEPLGQNGLAHLVEHICLSYRHSTEKFNINNHIFKRSNFQFSGYTNYDQTILNISFPNSIKCLKECTGIFDNIFSTAIVNENTFELSKNEILKECTEISDRWNYQSQIIQFITDNQITVLPVGNVNDIEQMTQTDVVNFMRECYNDVNVAIIIQTSISVSVAKKYILPIIPAADKKSFADFNIIEKKTFHNAKDITIETLCLNNPAHQKKVEIYFHKPYEHVNLKKKVTRMLFEIMTKKRIEQYIFASCSDNIYQDIYISDKHITDFFYYSVFTLCFIDNYDINALESFTKKIVKYIKEINFSEYEFYQAKDIILEYTSKPNIFNVEDIFENLSANFFMMNQSILQKTTSHNYTNT